MTTVTERFADLEARLRRDLPHLADSLTGTPADELPGTPDVGTGRAVGASGGVDDGPHGGEAAVVELSTGDGRSRRWFLGAAAAAAGAVAVGGVAAVARRGDDADPVTAAERPVISGPAPPTAPDATLSTAAVGRWDVLPDGLLEPRAHPVMGLIGEDVVVFAGSSVDRSFARADGAAFNLPTWAWQDVPVPGWGHPGLTGVTHGDRIAVVAKGTATLLDFARGEWIDLPPTEDMFLSRLAVVGRFLYAVGLSRAVAAGEFGTTLRRWNDEAGRWDHLPATGDQRPFFTTQPLDVPVVTHGRDIVVWDPVDGTGWAFDTAPQLWRPLPGLPSLDAPQADQSTGPGTVAASTVVPVGGALWAVAETVDGTGAPSLRLAVLTGDGWRWQHQLPSGRLGGIQLVPAGDWLVVLGATSGPRLLHAPSGRLTLDPASPVGGRLHAGTVWTGEELVIWGGERFEVPGQPDPVVGVRWTPPSPADA